MTTVIHEWNLEHRGFKITQHEYYQIHKGRQLVWEALTLEDAKRWIDKQY